MDTKGGGGGEDNPPPPLRSFKCFKRVNSLGKPPKIGLNLPENNYHPIFSFDNEMD